jgi:hypothetical protein
MKITEDVRKYAAEQQLSDEEALKMWLEKEARKFIDLHKRLNPSPHEFRDGSSDMGETQNGKRAGATRSMEPPRMRQYRLVENQPVGAKSPGSSYTANRSEELSCCPGAFVPLTEHANS